MRIRQLGFEAAGPESAISLPQRVSPADRAREQARYRGPQVWLRCWWNAHALGVSGAAFRDGRLDAITQRQPHVTLRPLDQYLRHGLDVRRRAYAVHGHFAWVSRCLPQGLIARLYAGERVALLGPGETPVPGLGVALAAADDDGRGGELALHLQWHGASVMSIAFSVLDASVVVDARDPHHQMGARIVIGSLRGRRGADEALRAISRASQRLRPRALLVLAAQALSMAWDLAPPLAVTTRSHVSSGRPDWRKQIRLDYDEVWMEVGGYPIGRHYWVLPEAPDLRPDDEVPSHRRAQNRRRNALRASLIDAVRTSTSALAATL